jgi:hypothetical protein
MSGPLQEFRAGEATRDGCGQLVLFAFERCYEFDKLTDHSSGVAATIGDDLIGRLSRRRQRPRRMFAHKRSFGHATAPIPEIEKTPRLRPGEEYRNVSETKSRAFTRQVPFEAVIARACRWCKPPVRFEEIAADMVPILYDRITGAIGSKLSCLPHANSSGISLNRRSRNAGPEGILGLRSSLGKDPNGRSVEMY